MDNLVHFPGAGPEEDLYEKAIEKLWVAIANGYHHEELNAFIESLPEDSELKVALVALKAVVGNEAYTL